MLRALLCAVILLTSVSDASKPVDVYKFADELRASIRGYVFLRGSPDYETARPVHNGACRHIFPLVIVKPMNTDDVSATVRLAVYHGLELSVRGGGHSFQCLGTKTDSVHIDLRLLNKVEFHPPHVVRMGAGNTWKNVLDVVDPNKYTLIHGNAKNVGVGGYLLGVGVNPIGTSQRHGYGADHVIEYKMVLADGSVALVGLHNTTIVKRDGKPVYEVYEHTEESDLKYALRAAGPSYGIVTEFLYKVYPHPETLSSVIMTFIKDGKDLQKLIRAGQDGRYGISVLQPMLFRKPKASLLIAWMMIKVPQIIRWNSGKPIEPTFVSVVDLRANNRKTPAGPALAFMKSYGLDVALDNVGMMERFGLDKVDFVADDQESVYMTPEELKAEGYHGMVSANANGLKSFKAVEELFLHHPTFGMYNRKTPTTDKNHGCDFCLWVLYIQKPGVHDNLMLETPIGHMSVELDCTFDASDPIKAKYCPAIVNKIQRQLYANAKKYGERPRQYVNTPGCDDEFFGFQERFWGNSYPRLVKIKQYWDPYNVFNYCHSVGSTEENCCVI